MIVTMGRFAKIWALGLVAFFVATAWAIAQGRADEPSVRAGSIFSLRELRRFEIEGVRLGMTEGVASDALTSRGYTAEGDGLPGRVHFYSPDRQTRISFGYANEMSPRIVDEIALQRSMSPREMMDAEARRAEILALLGRPTRWTRQMGHAGYVEDQLLYASNSMIAEHSLDLWSCNFDWRCAHVDCRTYLPAMERGGMINVSFSSSGYWIEAFDFSAYARAMQHDRASMANDTSGRICYVPAIH